MNNSKQSTIDNFLKQFPKDEIIETLNNIDTKISSLHTISSKDFLFFNTLLKEYYAKIKDISEANNSLSLFFSKNLPEITENIKDKNTTLKSYIDKSKSNNQKVIEFLSIIYASFDMVIVPFNNYKQNLITFKYILANLKLHLGYVNLSNNNELKHSVNSLEDHVDNISNQIDSIYNKTHEVSGSLIDLKEFALAAHEKNNEEVFDKLKNISNQIKKLSIEEYWPSNTTIDLTRRTQNCFANMGDVITNIQYHDIIRQKMEHIQSSQKTLVDGLNQIQSENDNQALENQLEFIVKIPEITDIQVAQLLYTNKDYQTSIEKITSKLISVGHEMKEVHNLYNTINLNIERFEDYFISDMVVSQNYFNDFAKSINASCANISAKFKGLFENYEHLKLDYNNIFNNEKSLRKEIKNFEKLIEVNGKQFGSELVKRLVQLLTDLQSNSNSLKTNLNNITTNYRSLNNLVSSFNCEDKIFEIGTEVLNKLESEAKETKNICKDFTKLSLNISEEIAQSLKKIEYYTFFKKTVEEIVQLLNDINTKVNYDSLSSIVGNNEEILKKIEQLYTMKSERDIHQILTESDKNVNEVLEEENNDIDDMDIELF